MVRNLSFQCNFGPSLPRFLSVLILSTDYYNGFILHQMMHFVFGYTVLRTLVASPTFDR